MRDLEQREPDRPREAWGGHCELASGCTNPTACMIHKQCQLERARSRANPPPPADIGAFPHPKGAGGSGRV